jgi:hypothetical protein
MASLDSLVVFYHLKVSEIWPDKRGDIRWEGSCKRGDIWWEGSCKRGDIWWEGSCKRGATVIVLYSI